MSQNKEDPAAINTTHTEVSIALSEEATHVEITIPSKQAKRLLYPMLLVISHLFAVGIVLAGRTPSIPHALSPLYQTIQHSNP